MFEPITITGNIVMGGIDVTEQVRELRISADLDIVNIPPTMPSPHWGAAGGASRWNVEVVYMSHPSTTTSPTTSLTSLLWDAISTPPHHVPFSGTFRPGATTEDNPSFAGTMVVTSWGLGGSPRALAEQSATYRLVAPPTRIPSPGGIDGGDGGEGFSGGIDGGDA